MISEAVVEALQRFVPRENISLQEPMAGHTTFRIGGPADCFLQLENAEQLKNLRRYLGMAGVPFFVLGNGSNLLVNDSGYRGVILQIGQKMSNIAVEGCRIVAQAGATMAQVARAAMEQGERWTFCLTAKGSAIFMLTGSIRKTPMGRAAHFLRLLRHSLRKAWICGRQSVRQRIT